MAENGNSSQNGWAKTLVGVVLTGFVIGLITWGETRATVADHGRRLDRSEGIAEAISELKTAVAVLAVEIKFMREQRNPTRAP